MKDNVTDTTVKQNQPTPTGTPVVYRDFHTKCFKIITFGDVSLRVASDDFKDINEASAWVSSQGGTMGAKKFHPFIGGYREIYLPPTKSQ